MINKKISKDYQFSGKLNRVRSLEQILPLFDSPEDVKIEGTKANPRHYGKIAGIAAVIEFSKVRPCRLYAKSKSELKIEYEKILNNSYKK